MTPQNNAPSVRFTLAAFLIWAALLVVIYMAFVQPAARRVHQRMERVSQEITHVG